MTGASWLMAFLKGAPFEKLVGKTYDGLAVRADLSARTANGDPDRGPCLRPRPGRSCNGSITPIPAAANAQVIHDLENGASGLEIGIRGGARGAQALASSMRRRKRKAAV